MLNFLNRRPQELCKQCGRCCRVATTSMTYEELKTEAKNGNTYAQDFLNLLIPYESIEKAKEADCEIVENILKYTTPDKFYSCKYLNSDNKCSRYETRFELCKLFPSSPWAITPPNCGFEHWLKEEAQNTIEYVKNLKLDKLEFQQMIENSENEAMITKLRNAIGSIDKIVELYHDYGSENW